MAISDTVKSIRRLVELSKKLDKVLNEPDSGYRSSQITDLESRIRDLKITIKRDQQRLSRIENQQLDSCARRFDPGWKHLVEDG